MRNAYLVLTFQRYVVPETGIEPVRAFWTRGILSPLRLPIPPLRQESDFNTATMAHRQFSSGPSRAGHHEKDTAVTLQCE